MLENTYCTSASVISLVFYFAVETLACVTGVNVLCNTFIRHIALF